MPRSITGASAAADVKDFSGTLDSFFTITCQVRDYLGQGCRMKGYDSFVIEAKICKIYVLFFAFGYSVFIFEVFVFIGGTLHTNT